MHPLIETITQSELKPDRSNFKVGDGVKVHVKIPEGDKERIQIFQGIVIAHRGRGASATFTVRRVTQGDGVERVFPLHSPNIDRVEVDRESVTMKARMYFMRKRVGKSANKVKEKRLVEALNRKKS